MIKKVLQNKLTQKFLGWIISFYLKFCFQSSLWYVKNDEVINNLITKKKVLVFFWHNRLLMAPFCWKYKNKFKMLISQHHDGRIISYAVSHFGIETIQGSSSKSKISSTKSILKELERSSVVGITPDGPRGPKEKIKEGIISIQKKTNAIIIPLSYSARFKIKFNSWDNFIFIFPFNKFVAVWGNPITYNSKESILKNIQRVESELKRVTKLSDNLSK